MIETDGLIEFVDGMFLIMLVDGKEKGEKGGQFAGAGRGKALYSDGVTR